MDGSAQGRQHGKLKIVLSEQQLINPLVSECAANLD
jgi:hypothetical protein